MKPIQFVGCGLAMLGGTALAAAPVQQTVRKPNIVFVLADDLGREALGCYGGVKYKGLGPVRTPNLDAMARNGMLFRHCFACPVCSPARSEALTGKYDFRVGFPRVMGMPGVVDQLDSSAHPTVAMRLKEAGYATAVVGKWHVGPPFTKANEVELVPTTADEDTAFPHPRTCGFDRQCLFSGGHLSTYGQPTPGKYTPELLQQWALKFLDGRKGKPDPFFLYYASPIPHGPLYPTPLNPNAVPNRSDRANYPYLIEYLDKQVGELLAKLSARGMRENTLVLFAGDNGSYAVTTEMRDGHEVKGGKGSPLDTGAWVPLLAEWPGVVRAGSVYEGMVDFTDILPTCLELAGLTPHQGVDGVSFAPQLQGRPGQPRDAAFVLGGDRWYARDARWKLTNAGKLYDVCSSLYAEVPVGPAKETAESKAARARLQAVLDRVHPEKALAPTPEDGGTGAEAAGDE